MRALTPVIHECAATADDQVTTSSLVREIEAPGRAEHSRWRSSKAVTRLGVLCVVLSFLPVVRSQSQSLADVTAQLVAASPGITLSDVLHLGNSLVLNVPLLALADASWASPNGRLHNANLAAVASTLFGVSGHGEAAKRAKSLISIGSRGLGIVRQTRFGSLPLPLVPSISTRILVTSHKVCPQCGSGLRPRSGARSVWIAHPSRLERAKALIQRCTHAKCNTILYPAHFQIKTLEGAELWSFDVDSELIRVGPRVYATRAFVESYTNLFETSNQTFAAHAEMYNRMYASPDWLSSKLLWTAFVLGHTLQLARERGIPVTTSAHPTVDQLVELALTNFLASRTIPGALEHQCPECCRYKRTWTEAPGGREITHSPDDSLVEQTTINTDLNRIRRMAVMDGIQIGHLICAVPGCKNDPMNFVQDRFCTGHRRFYTTCNVIGCTSLKVVGEGENDACALPAHQAAWRAHVRARGRADVGGLTRIVTQARLQANRGRTEDGIGGLLPRKSSVTHPDAMWSYRTTSALQLIVYSCGTIVGWDKLYNKEDPEEVLQTISNIFGDAPLPTFIAYDQGCKLLVAIQEDPKLYHWLDKEMRIIVDTFHFNRHSPYDVVCREFCNPDASNDLVVPLVQRGEEADPAAHRVYRRAFNTQAAEQLNSWLIGFAPSLRNMTSKNHDFVLSVLLRRRYEQRTETLVERYDHLIG